MLIAKYLKSSNTKDIELASELLNIEQADISDNNSSGKLKYESYTNWLKENQPYLYFTEESFQYSSTPKFCNVDLARKYLNKKGEGNKKSPISSNELKEFNKLKIDEQKIISQYSQKICNNNSEWSDWRQMPINQQIKVAKSRLGGI